jgi:hypothetical protein
VSLVPLVPLKPNSEGLSATKFDALIKPRFGERVAQNREIVISHFELLASGIQQMQQVQELDSSGSRDHGSMA